MGVSLDGGTPKTPEKMVVSPMVVGYIAPLKKNIYIYIYTPYMDPIYPGSQRP